MSEPPNTPKKRIHEALDYIDDVLANLERERRDLINESIQQADVIRSQELHIKALQNRIIRLEDIAGVEHQTIPAMGIDSAVDVDPETGIDNKSVLFADASRRAMEAATEATHRRNDMYETFRNGDEDRFEDRIIDYQIAMTRLIYANIRYAKTLKP